MKRCAAWLAWCGVVAFLAGCSGGARAARRDAIDPQAAADAAPVVARAATSSSVPLVVWDGPVEHLFFHTLLVEAAVAFSNPQIGHGFLDWFVTVREFRAILDQLYEHGEVKVEVHDDGRVRLTDDDVVPIVDEFVAAHPDFAADGAKGVLAVTGDEGVLGERLDTPASVQRAKALVARLKATGWTFASHSYAHFDESEASLDRLVDDSQEWQASTAPIVGPTDVYVFPFGAGYPIGSAKLEALRAFGFRVF